MLFVTREEVAPKLEKLALNPGPGVPFVQFAAVDQLKSFVAAATPDHMPFPLKPPELPVTNVQVLVWATEALFVKVATTVLVELTARLPVSVYVPVTPTALLLI